MAKVKITLEVEIDAEVLQNAIDEKDCTLSELKNKPNFWFIHSATIYEELGNLISAHDLSANELEIDLSSDLDSLCEWEDYEEEEEDEEDVEEEDSNDTDDTTKPQQAKE